MLSPAAEPAERQELCIPEPSAGGRSDDVTAGAPHINSSHHHGGGGGHGSGGLAVAHFSAVTLTDDGTPSLSAVEAASAAAAAAATTTRTTSILSANAEDGMARLVDAVTDDNSASHDVPTHSISPPTTTRGT